VNVQEDDGGWELGTFLSKKWINDWLGKMRLERAEYKTSDILSQRSKHRETLVFVWVSCWFNWVIDNKVQLWLDERDLWKVHDVTNDGYPRQLKLMVVSFYKEFKRFRKRHSSLKIKDYVSHYSDKMRRLTDITVGEVYLKNDHFTYELQQNPLQMQS
jgi:hypothetical protein